MCDVMEEYIAEERAKVLKEGQEREKRLLTLVARMSQNGESDKIEQLQNPEFLQEMFRKYHLE